MEIKAFKGIGTVALASFTFLATPFPKASAEAVQAQPELNLILSNLPTETVSDADHSD